MIWFQIIIECREILDSASPSLNMVNSDTSDKQTEVKIVLDKSGNIWRECTVFGAFMWVLEGVPHRNGFCI